MLAEDLKEIYPFKSNFYEIDGNKYHYIDEGQGNVIVLFHGNPTWSFYYRNVIKVLSKTHRVICPDHMGCGLSDKPQNYEYQLKNHFSNAIKLLNNLSITAFDMVVHDWGGAIGFGVLANGGFKVDKVAILNTAAYTDDNLPFSIMLCKIPVLGPFIVRQFNAFARPATFMTTTKRLSKVVKKGYLLPYNNYQNRKAVAEFVKDIPMFEGHRSWADLKNIEKYLSTFKGSVHIFWGGKDFCFNDHFYHRWQTIFPEAGTTYYKNAGHYVLEDASGDIEPRLQEFFH